MELMKTYFKQSCPTCGQPLFVSVDLRDSRVMCAQCSSVFLARFSGNVNIERQEKEFQNCETEKYRLR